MSKRKLITIGLSGCRNMKECQKVVDMLSSGKIKISVSTIKK